MDSIYNLLIYLASKHGYWFIAAAMFLDSVNIPLGSEIILPLGGYMSRISVLNIYVLISLTTISTTLGALLNYYLGFWGGEVFFKKHRKMLLISEEDQRKALEWFNKYGNLTAFFGRLIPGVRTFISFPAGVAKVRFLPFAIYTFLGSLVWCSGFCYAGYILGKHWKDINLYLKDFHIVIIITVVVLLALYVIHLMKKLK